MTKLVPSPHSNMQRQSLSPRSTLACSDKAQPSTLPLPGARKYPPTHTRYPKQQWQPNPLITRVILGNPKISADPATASETCDKSPTFGPWPLGLRARLPLERSRYNFRGQVEEVPQVLDALVGQVPVVVTPGKLLTDEPTRLQALK